MQGQPAASKDMCSLQGGDGPAEGRKKDPERRPSRQWDEASFYEELSRRQGEPEAAVAPAPRVGEGHLICSET
jgi:hypothetical protein